MDIEEAVSPVRMVSAKNITGPVLDDVIGLTGPQLTGPDGPVLTSPDIKWIKGETGNLISNYVPPPVDAEEMTTDNDAYMRAGTYSPDTDVGILPPRSQDITVFCQQCQRYVELRGLHNHRFFHRSLEILKYKGATRPENVDKLLKRRQAVLRKMKKQKNEEKSLDPVEIEKVNAAFEFLKADLEDTFEAFRLIKGSHDTSVRGIGLNCSAACAPAVGICSDSNDRWKSYMEDTRVFQDHFGNDMHKCYFGVYDGHHGRFAAEIAANELHHALLLDMAKFDPRTKCTCTFNMADSYDISQYEIHSRAPSRISERGEIHGESTNVIQQIISTCEERFAELENQKNEKNEEKKAKKEKKKKKERDPFAEKMSDAFVKAHKYVDYLLSWGKDEQSRVRWSGCSTLCCVIQNTEISPSSVDFASVKESTPKPDEVERSTSAASNVSKAEPPRELGIMHLANAGNTRGVLVRGNVAYRLTRDHTPNNPKEKHRVMKEGVNVNDSEHDLRVNGVIATTRGLGNHGDVALKKSISNVPYTTSVKIDQYAQFLILASNGIWEVFSEQEAASILLQMFPYNQIPPASDISSTVGKILIDSKSQIGTESEVASEAARMVFGIDRKSALSNYGDHSKSPLSNIRDKVGTSAKSRASVKFADEEAKAQEIDAAENLHDGSGDMKNDVHTSQANGKEGRNMNNDRKLKETKKEDNEIELAMDLQTEVGSNIDIYSDEESEDDSGNEADIDTISDGLTLPRTSSLAIDRVPTKDEIQREFARKLSERLVQSALLAGAKDNVTAIVILLPGCGI